VSGLKRTARRQLRGDDIRSISVRTRRSTIPARLSSSHTLSIGRSISWTRSASVCDIAAQLKNRPRCPSRAEAKLLRVPRPIRPRGRTAEFSDAQLRNHYPEPPEVMRSTEMLPSSKCFIRAITRDDARRIAANIAKLPELLLR
jgi:hypothetical protein